MVLVAYLYGPRAAGLVDVRWHQTDFRAAVLHVRRVEQGSPSTHPILRATSHHVLLVTLAAMSE